MIKQRYSYKQLITLADDVLFKFLVEVNNATYTVLKRYFSFHFLSKIKLKEYFTHNTHALTCAASTSIALLTLTHHCGLITFWARSVMHRVHC